MALDFIKEKKEKILIPVARLPVIKLLINLSIRKKYDECKFDSELIDLLKVSDLIEEGSN